ncbi:hypothetical protein M409DRAFT_19072 [Zasmidium cellare ATCC 36951]|uniref:F-box domain-containing protein n=1 Tax=Zasmidium cellare ATCC 36951 TaxID=1080233 RepID=A0A6A6CVG2_ZASCE|nr:uncharacterized protein M409DRAFT_19072 [Zasmidium cellare ATCC 36951]KAF2171101.1 hypothetical protein M409DRAFT_19072 [Zasmidium cellare ATCC 36951]
MAHILSSISRRWRSHREASGVGQTRKLSKKVRVIHAQTGRTVSIATTTTPENLLKCHPQDQSPLFKLPAEIRTLIFTYALTPDPWTDSFDAQLGHPTGRFYTQILQTCRLIWLEANTYLLDNAAPEFFLYRSNPFGDSTDEGHSRVRGVEELERFVFWLTPNNLARMHLTINVDMEVLTQQNSGKTFGGGSTKWPSRVTMILRFRRYTVRPQLAVDHSADPDVAEDVISEVLQHAALAGVTRFTLRMQAIVELRSELNLTVMRLSSASIRDVLAPGWLLDSSRCESPRRDDRSKDGSFDVAVLEWYRNDGGPDYCQTQDLGDVQTPNDGQSFVGAAAAYSKHWNTQGSLLHLLAHH